MEKLSDLRSAELKYVKEVLTPMNPRSLYYQNLDDLAKMYYGVVLVGMLMITYMLVS